MDHERILHIYDYLCRYGAGEPGVTVRQIRDYLAQSCNLSAVSPLTIRRDIDRLCGMGYDIRQTAGAHNTAHYRIVSHGFSFNEIRFIVDSVSINKFLSDAEKTRLIKKFEGLCSEQDVRRLISRVTLTHHTPSSDLLKNLEQVHQIIGAKCKIHFEYGRYDVRRQVQFYSKRRDVIPVRVEYSNERFYLICISEETGERRTYRIDRMRNIRQGEKSQFKGTLPRPDGAVVDIFTPERFVTVTLRVRHFLLDEMLETFGRYAAPEPDPAGAEWVRIRVRVGISQGFYSFVQKYGADLEVLAPADLRSAVAAQYRRICAMYEEK